VFAVLFREGFDAESFIVSLVERERRVREINAERGTDSGTREKMQQQQTENMRDKWEHFANQQKVMNEKKMRRKFTSFVMRIGQMPTGGGSSGSSGGGGGGE